MDPTNLEKSSGTERQSRPKIIYQIHYAPHGTPEDQRGLHELIHQADIYIPEGFGNSALSKIMYNAISQGRKTPEEATQQMIGSEFSETSLGELNSLYGTKIPVTFIDIPAYDNLFIEGEPTLSLSVGNIDELFQSVRSYLMKISESDKRREQHMLDQLKPMVDTTLDEYPELKAKKQLRVLLSLGSFHTRIYHELQKSGQDVVREFGEMPPVYSLHDEAERRMIFNKPVSDELVSQVLLEIILDDFYRDQMQGLCKGSTKISRYIRLVASSFTLDEIRNFILGFVPLANLANITTFTQVEPLRKGLDFFLKEKGISIPTTEKELDSLLDQLSKKH